MDRTHSDMGKKLSAIVDDAIADLLLLGMDSRDDAAFMMAAQASIRIEDNEKMRELEKYVSELVWDVDDLRATPSRVPYPRGGTVKVRGLPP